MAFLSKDYEIKWILIGIVYEASIDSIDGG